jgi:hypothetical protein
MMDWSVGCVVTAGAVQAEFTASVPLPVDESPVTAALFARTVNGLEPAGVAAVVVIVSVEVLELSAAAKLTVLGLNEALAPEGRAVVTLRSALKAVPVAPLRFTVTVYVALPAVPLVSVPICAPTVTAPTRFATTSVADPDVGPPPWQARSFVPLTVIGKLPVGVAAVVAMLRDVVTGLLPLPAVATGLVPNVALAPAGRPLALSVTLQGVLFPPTVRVIV